jgi:hypothetical protein
LRLSCPARFLMGQTSNKYQWPHLIYRPHGQSQWDLKWMYMQPPVYYLTPTAQIFKAFILYYLFKLKDWQYWAYHTKFHPIWFTYLYPICYFLFCNLIYCYLKGEKKNILCTQLHNKFNVVWKHFQGCSDPKSLLRHAYKKASF